MPIKDEASLEALCEKYGVKREDYAMLLRNGITDSAACKAEEFGITARDLRDLYYQFGKPFVPMFLTFISMVKPPKVKEHHKPKPAPAKPEPKPEDDKK